MQKRKFWEIVFQWVFPCALLVVALVLSIYEFNNKMNSAIQTVVDDQAEQIGYYYSAGVDDKLGALGDITSAMANIMASRPDRSDAFVYEKLDTIVKASNAYMSAYCAVHGEMAEWLKAPVLKTGDVKASVGSNPTLSANFHIVCGSTQVAEGAPLLRE